MARKLAAVAITLGCLHASSLMALGLGEMKLESYLNEPLQASVDLLNLGGLHADEIRIRLGTSDDFDKLGLDRAYFLTSIKFEVADDGSGGARIVISSEEPVVEPYLDFIIEARWPSGRLLRNYTVLLDPPVFASGTRVVSASQRVEEVEGIAAPPKKSSDVTASGASANEDDPTLGSWGSEAGRNSGTRVDMRGSDLAPGAMPHRGYDAATSPAPTPGSRYMINRDQTLWDIASRAKPAGASVHQTMLDIQRLNPDAFINGNINRIKAGYIIYLPTADDISSGDLSATLAEVREQNAAWREGRDAQLNATKRPSLRISAEPEQGVDATSGKVTAPGAASTTGTTSQTPSAGKIVPEPATTPTAAAALDTASAQERLAAIEEQLATLQRIVSLKDEQIAALQAAVQAAPGTTTATPGTEPALAPTDMAAPVVEVESVVEGAISVPPPEAIPLAGGAPAVDSPPPLEPDAKTVPAAEAKTDQTANASKSAGGDSWTSYILYVLGALVLLVAGVVFVRRRGVEDHDTGSARHTAAKEDVFSEVRLQDQRLAFDARAEDTEGDLPAPDTRSNRGYGERKHDEYASDVDSADALAEADIYIAYGRHPQAIDLLNNALAGEPGNALYRLKLLEIYIELNNRSAATAQLAKIRSVGDSESIAQAESLMARLDADADADTDAAPEPAKASVRDVGRMGRSTPNPLAMMTDSADTLEADFTGLEIEGSGTSVVDDDLDLSSDFRSADPDHFENEELLIAADSNGLSTKLDLARAYLDMGDDDGARQILDEVVAEGSEELQAEARTLLNRIGG